MKHFANLFTELDSTTSTNAKVAALQAYFQVAPPEDAAWAVYFLSGGKPRQVVGSRGERRDAAAILRAVFSTPRGHPAASTPRLPPTTGLRRSDRRDGGLIPTRSCRWGARIAGGRADIGERFLATGRGAEAGAPGAAGQAGSR